MASYRALRTTATDGSIDDRYEVALRQDRPKGNVDEAFIRLREIGKMTPNE